MAANWRRSYSHEERTANGKRMNPRDEKDIREVVRREYDQTKRERALVSV